MHYILAIAVIALYFLPGIIAIARNKTNQFRILGLNALTGWTIIGWGASFVWAMMNEVIDGDRPGRYESIPSGPALVTDDHPQIAPAPHDDGKVRALFSGDRLGR